MINKSEFDGFKYIDGGVCASNGFKASGLYCGIKASEISQEGENSAPVKNDIALLVSDCMCNVASVYTQNKVKGAPIVVTKDNLKKSGNKAKAVIVNSKNANTCNADGQEKALKMCQLTADALNIKTEEVIVASTGVIGQVLPIEPIISAVPKLVEKLSYTGNADAVNAIMTTDTMPKECAVQFELNGKKCVVGGMLKGSGMIHPNMATTLTFITTDVAIAPEYLQRALSDLVKYTMNMVSVDGDTSTNDMVSVLANGLSGNSEIKAENEDYDVFRNALYIVMMNLSRMMARDGEGATKLIECVCSGADDLVTAQIVAKSVITSSLFKSAMFGEDANWGRILCAVGYAQADFDINNVDVRINSAVGSIDVCKNGSGVDFSEEVAKKILQEEEIIILISIGDGDFNAIAWGCDLTYDYVKINGDYRS